jgi:hypothetical protein
MIFDSLCLKVRNYWFKRMRLKTDANVTRRPAQLKTNHGRQKAAWRTRPRVCYKTSRAIMKATLLLLLPLAVLAADPAPRHHAETITAARREFVIRMGGTMDGENTRTPVGYGAWSRAFEPMREVRIENVGDTLVVNPWLIVNGRRDWRTVEKIVAEATRGCANDRERAIAIWRFVINNRFHATPNDGDNIDPVKQFNVYGYSLCGDIAQTIRQLWKVAGFKTRCGRPHGHCLTEVWFDNEWRMLDGDEQIICLRRDNETIGN